MEGVPRHEGPGARTTLDGAATRAEAERLAGPWEPPGLESELHPETSEKLGAKVDTGVENSRGPD